MMVQDFEEWERRSTIADGIDLESDMFPRLWTLSPAFMYRFLPVPIGGSTPPEYVQVPTSDELGLKGDENAAYQVFIAEWNTTWESRLERIGIHYNEVPQTLQWLKDSPVDVRLVPKPSCIEQFYDLYKPLYHLLSRSTLDRFGLPYFKRGGWPYCMDRMAPKRQYYPDHFDKRVEQAFGYHVWPHLGPRGIPSSFATDEPIRLLSHNLDFWLPFIDLVVQEQVISYGRVPFDNDKQIRDYESYKDKMPDGVSLERPLHGGDIWCGEDEASEATNRLIEVADKAGNLRGILDAVRSHRVEDDFSEKWSYEREDFERRLYRKRSSVKVRFVELDDTIPVHGPASEIHEKLLWEDFFAILDAKERQIVVCLRNGFTRVGEVAKELGYANHSPISKKLKKIRRKAARFLDLEQGGV